MAIEYSAGHSKGGIKMTKIIAATTILAMSFACNNANKTQQGVATKKLFYMVSPNFNKGPDMPATVVINSPEDFFNTIKAENDKAYFLATFALGGKEGYFLTTSIVYTKDGNGMKGWNVINNRGGKGLTERKYFSVANKEKADIALGGALYLVATEVPLEATQENISTERLDMLLKPSFNYLKSLL